MRYLMRAAGLALLISSGPLAPPAGAQTDLPWNTLDGAAPLIIAHRGASGDRPEHTLEAYRLAVEQGADVIEPDLVMSSDGVLVVRHDRYLSTTTNVADRPEFADRQRESDGRLDWWVEDFSLAELRTLRARQPWPERDAAFNDQFVIPTFEEVLDLAAELGVPTEPEMKSPEHFTRIGLDPLPELVRILRARGLDNEDAATAIQCFEPDFLRRLNAQVDTPLLMLVFEMNELDPDAMQGTPTVSLAEAATFADGVGPAKSLVINPDGSNTGFIHEAHALGLTVHPWTFRDDVPMDPARGVEWELRQVMRFGADGVFTDFPATGVRVRGELAAAFE